MDTLIAIDTETTGLSFESDRVIQFGMTAFIKGRAVYRTSLDIQSDIPNSAYSINGISEERIAAGLDPEYAFSIISGALHRGTKVILAYNAPFDLMMLAHSFRRLGIVYDFERLQIIDPLVIHRHYHPFRPAPTNKLLYVCEQAGIPYDNAHDAADDSEAAGHLFFAQKVRHGIRGSALDLHRRQERWHKEWADSYISWGRRKGREIIVTPWPYDPDYAKYLEGEQSLLF